MPIKCQTVFNLMEQLAPKSLAEEWDNIGLQTGNPANEVEGILCALDVTEQVVDEARSLGANLIISHHPLIFKPLKNIREDLPSGRLLAKIIRNEINVFCAHTNLDSAREGVNQVLAERMNLQDISVLNGDKTDKLYKFVVFVPQSHTEAVRRALAEAGAGWIGHYSDCSFMMEGTGVFKPLEGTAPFVGEQGKTEFVHETRIETVVKEKQIDKTIKAVLKVHPYEEVAYDLYPLLNHSYQLGLGRIGTLKESVIFKDFLGRIKDALGVVGLRYAGDAEARINKVAVCGGSGAGLIHKAKYAGADLLLTGDVKYHEAQEAEAIGLCVVDAGHFATENVIVEKIVAFLKNGLQKEAGELQITASKQNIDCIQFFK